MRWCDLTTFLMNLMYFSFTAAEEKNEMQKLEERARQLAAESVADQPKQDKGILFVRLVLLLSRLKNMIIKNSVLFTLNHIKGYSLLKLLFHHLKFTLIEVCIIKKM